MNRTPKTRYIPAEYKQINTPPDVDAVIYVKDNSALAYSGKRTKPDFYYNFYSLERRDKYISEYIQSQRDRYQMMAERKAARNKFEHRFQVGDILYNSWGYDQTNIDYYQVVEVPSGKTIRIRPISQTTTGSGFMCGHTIPCPDHFTGPAELKHVQPHPSSKDEPGWVSFKFGGGDKWDGRPLYCSWYA